MKRYAISLLVPLGCLAVMAQSLPNLSVNLNANGKVHIVWPMPTVSSILQESSSLSSTGAWQTTTLNIITNGCNCQVLASATNSPRFYRLASTNPPPVGIYLGQPTQLLKIHELGMSMLPDMHIAVMQQTNKSYRLWITGHFEEDTYEGATGLLLTTNFTDFVSGYSPGTTNVVPVFVPSYRGPTINTMAGGYTNFDADYAGANLVWTATNGTDLLMLYHGESKAFGTNAPNPVEPSWSVVGLARSSNQGIIWTNREVIISGSEDKPATNPPVAQLYGVVEPGAIIAGNYLYAYYSYFSMTPATNPPEPVIQVARSALTNDGAPGTWTKYYTNAFDSQPGLGGKGSSVIPTICGCTRPAQPWPVFSTYLNAYVLVFICKEGWFFSTSSDLVNWTAPIQFFMAPLPEFTEGQQTDENVILVTPGNPNQVIGQTGLVLYSHTPAWKRVSDELWSRPFTFTKSP